jgi:hypothetical protein
MAQSFFVLGRELIPQGNLLLEFYVDEIEVQQRI